MWLAMNMTGSTFSVQQEQREPLPLGDGRGNARPVAVAPARRSVGGGNEDGYDLPADGDFQPRRDEAQPPPQQQQQQHEEVFVQRPPPPPPPVHRQEQPAPPQQRRESRSSSNFPPLSPEKQAQADQRRDFIRGVRALLCLLP